MAEWTKVSPIGWTRGLTISAAIALLTGAMIAPTMAQTIREDNTLGNENSRVVRNVRIRGVESDRIEGGATRGQNLFHSFSEFNVPAERGAYFLNPDGIRNIFGRVTGGGRSEIFGNLGVIRADGFIGNANLFLINPNGILFGRTAHLDLNGAFVGTTANAIQFGNLGNFSATESNLPTALTINPSAFLFNQINTPVGAITVTANQPIPWNTGFSGLRVRNGQSLTFLGRTITVEGAQLNAFGGRVNLAAINAGTVGLAENGSLTVPTLARGDVTFTNGAKIDVTLGDGGDIALIGRNINVLGSTLSAGIFSGFGTATSQAGNLVLNATGAVRVGESSRIENDVKTNARGNSGDINITANSLEVTGGSQLSASTFGQGNAGNVILNVGDRVSFEGTSGDFPSAAFSRVENGVRGQGGNVQITAGSLLVTNGAQLNASTLGRGNAGSVIINTRDRVSFNNAFAFSSVGEEAVGQGGNVQITTDSLDVVNGSQIITGIYPAGRGNAGSVIINARDQVSFNNGSIFSDIDRNAIGNGGNIQITTRSLEIVNGGRLVTNTEGRGNAGSVIINARDRVSFNNGFIFSDIDRNAIGNGGNIQITTRSLEVVNGGQLIATTQGQGNAGNVIINARDRVSFDGIGTNGLSSTAFSRVNNGAEGQGGNVEITAGSLSVSNGARLNASTLGQGDAGSVIINVHDLTSLNNGFIFSNVGENAVGNGGNVRITTGSLSVTNRGQLVSSTSGQGNAGSVIINARDRVSFDDTSGGFRSAALSRVNSGATGRGGNVEVTAGSLSVSNGARLNASTLGQGDAGSVIINVHDLTSLNNGFIFSNVGENAVGNGGNVRITTGSLSVTNRGQLVSSTSGQGNAGSVIINARDRVSFNNAFAFSSVGEEAVGQGGNVQITTDSLDVVNGSQIITGIYPAGRGNAGSVIINARDRVSFNNGFIFSDIDRNAIGNGGNIQITTRSLEIINGGRLVTNTEGRGNAGSVIINARDRIALNGRGSAALSDVSSRAIGNGGNIAITTNSLFLSNGAQLVANTSGQGNAGRVTIRALEGITLDGVGTDGRSSGMFTGTDSSAVGRGNAILIITPSLQISNGAVIDASTANADRGGDIIINANRLTARSGGQIFTTATGAGQAGNIRLNVGNRILLEGSDSTYTARLNRFGRNITANQGAASGVFANTRSNSSGNGGTLTLQAGSLILRDGAQLSTLTSGTGNAGSIEVRGANLISLDSSTITTGTDAGAVLTNPNTSQGNILLQGRSLSLANRSRISADTSGRGNAGNIAVQTEQTQINNSTISTAVNAGAIGRGGDIDLRTRSLNLTNQAEVTASTAGQGDAGNITAQETDRISLTNRSQISSAVNPGAVGAGGRISIQTDRVELGKRSQISSAVNPRGQGAGGRIQIEANTVALNNQSQITASTAGQGNTGEILIQTDDSLQLGNRSQITSRVEQGAIGNSQRIRLSTAQLVLKDLSSISAATDGNGSAGDILVRADTITLNNSMLSTAIEEDGIIPDSNRSILRNSRASMSQASRARFNDDARQGNIAIQTRLLSLNNTANITASTSGRGNAGTIRLMGLESLSLSDRSTISTAVNSRAIGSGGSILVRANQIRLQTGSQIQTATSSQGNAGNISLETQTATLGGRGTGLIANSSNRGNGGNITLNTTDLSLSNRATISAQSQGQGTAGSITLNATGTISAQDGEIATSATRSSGGAININTTTNQPGDLRLRGDSDIRTSSQEDGGNITIVARSVLAFDDSDILASSQNANGGNIDLSRTPIFLGYLASQTSGNLEGNGRVDVNADGKLQAGTIRLPDLSFIQNGLSEAPSTPLEADSLLSNSCIVRDSSDRQNRFVITGADGLPTHPGNTSPSTFPTGTIQVIPETAPETTPETPAPNRSWQPGEAIVEPQGVYQLPNGRLILSRECSAESSQVNRPDR